jgi:hypothetical protein
MRKTLSISHQNIMNMIEHRPELKLAIDSA